MTDNEIIKALECCIAPKCGECPIFTNVEVRKAPGRCVLTLEKNALDLINRQKAEVEWLKQIQSDNEKAFNKMTELYNRAFNRCKTIKAEAIREFAERLKSHAHEISCNVLLVVTKDDINNLVKEMVGDAE